MFVATDRLRHVGGLVRLTGTALTAIPQGPGPQLPRALHHSTCWEDGRATLSGADRCRAPRLRGHHGLDEQRLCGSAAARPGRGLGPGGWHAAHGGPERRGAGRPDCCVRRRGQRLDPGALCGRSRLRWGPSATWPLPSKYRRQAVPPPCCLDRDCLRRCLWQDCRAVGSNPWRGAREHAALLHRRRGMNGPEQPGSG